MHIALPLVRTFRRLPLYLKLRLLLGGAVLAILILAALAFLAISLGVNQADFIRKSDLALRQTTGQLISKGLQLPSLPTATSKTLPAGSEEAVVAESLASNSSALQTGLTVLASPDPARLTSELLTAQVQLKAARIAASKAQIMAEQGQAPAAAAVVARATVTDLEAVVAQKRKALGMDATSKAR